MSEAVARQAAYRIREHADCHQLTNVHIVLHGGEPLLGGVRHLRMLMGVLSETFDNSPTDFDVTIQSNGTLLTEEIATELVDRDIGIGISLDGPPEYHDRYRVDHRGRGSSPEVERALQLLTTTAPFRQKFLGLLCVVNLDQDPEILLEYLFRYGVPIDLLLPLDHYDRRPPGKEIFADTPYGDWLVNAFDYWLQCESPPQVRLFETIGGLLLGVPSRVESIGLAPVDLVVIEAGGDIEALDALKAVYHGAAKLGYNVFDDTLSTVANDLHVRMRRMGAEGLCTECQRCPRVAICGGGYLPHRFSGARGYMNPSIYCTDLQRLIAHIEESMYLHLVEADLVPAVN